MTSDNHKTTKFISEEDWGSDATSHEYALIADRHVHIIFSQHLQKNDIDPILEWPELERWLQEETGEYRKKGPVYLRIMGALYSDFPMPFLTEIIGEVTIGKPVAGEKRYPVSIKTPSYHILPVFYDTQTCERFFVLTKSQGHGVPNENALGLLEGPLSDAGVLRPGKILPQNAVDLFKPFGFEDKVVHPLVGDFGPQAFSSSKVVSLGYIQLPLPPEEREILPGKLENLKLPGDCKMALYPERQAYDEVLGVSGKTRPSDAVLVVALEAFRNIILKDNFKSIQRENARLTNFLEATSVGQAMPHSSVHRPSQISALLSRRRRELGLRHRRVS